MTTPDPGYAGRHRGGPQPGPGRRGGTQEQLRVVLESQEAANEQMRQTMIHIQNAMDMVANTMGALAPDYNGPGFGRGPNGGRPTLNPNQSRRLGHDPMHTGGPGYGRGYSGLRSHIAGAIDQRYGRGSGSTFTRVYDPATGEDRGYIEHTTDGRNIQRGADWANTDEGRSALAGAARRASIGNGLRGLGQGGLTGASRAIPYVGAALMAGEAIHEGLAFVGNQREANARYQSIYGGSNFDQFGQRASQYGFQLGQLFGGGLTWGQSREAFQGVSALGYQGAQRSRDLDFVTQNYMRMGVGVADSLKLIQTAAGNLNESLSGLQEGLKNTREAAIATGQSGNVGTRIFTQTYQGLSQNFAGPGVSALASALAPMQASLGRYASSINLAGMLSDPGNQIMMAGRVGMTQTQFTGAIQSGNLRPVAIGMDRLLSSAMAPTLQNHEIQNFIQSQVRSLSLAPGQALSPDQAAQIASNLMNDPKAGNFIPGLMATLRARGVNVNTPQEAAQLMVTQSTGGLFSANRLKNLGVNNGIDLQHAAQNFRPAQRGGTPTRAGSGGIGPNIESVYNQANPVIEAAKRALTSGPYRQANGRGADVQVIGKDHKPRVVSLSEALRDYPDQIAQGTAVVMGTGGQTVSQIVGSHQTRYLSESQILSKYDKQHGTHYAQIEGHSPSDGSGTTASSSSDDLSHAAGMSPAAYAKWREKWNEKHAKKNPDGTSGKVVIEPSPELKALLNFYPSGNVQVANTAAAAGQIPGVSR